jgi:hypothetical protein
MPACNDERPSIAQCTYAAAGFQHEKGPGSSTLAKEVSEHPSP